MAKVKSPLLSLSASGSIAKTITFANWKGNAYVRELVIPANPRTAGQLEQRVIHGSLAKACVAVLTVNKDEALAGSLFFQNARDEAPSGQSWISNLISIMSPIYATVATAYGNETGTVQGYFQTAGEAAGLVDYVPSYSATPGATAGQQLYALAYFASEYLTGDVKGDADAALVGASQQDVTDFRERVTQTVA